MKQKVAVPRLAAEPEVRLGTAADSLWRSLTPPFTGGREPDGSVSTDVAVVGAGVAGLSTALHLAAEGIDCVVLEAEQPGSAATGTSGGILAPAFSRGGVASAVKVYGQARASRLARMVGRSAAFTFELISRHGIECDVTQCGFVSPVRQPDQVDGLRDDARRWQALGCRVRLLTAEETRAAIGTDAYAGALLFEDGGALNPVAYANGLADACIAAGVPVFTNSAVRSLERADGGFRLQLPRGRVHARRVVLAANGGNAALHPALKHSTLPLSVYEYATAAVPEEARERYFGEGLPYTDNDAYVFTARLAAGGRLVSALPEVIPRYKPSTFLQEVRRRIDLGYSMPVSSVDFVWHGTAWLNPTLLPVVYLPEDSHDLVAIQACNGRGLGLNSILGHEVAAFLATGRRDTIEVPLLKPKPVRFHAAASVVPRLLMAVTRLHDRRRRR